MTTGKIPQVSNGCWGLLIRQPFTKQHGIFNLGIKMAEDLKESSKQNLSGVFHQM